MSTTFTARKKSSNKFNCLGEALLMPGDYVQAYYTMDAVLYKALNSSKQSEVSSYHNKSTQ